MQGLGQIFAKHGVRFNRQGRRGRDLRDTAQATEETDIAQETNDARATYDTHVTKAPEHEKLWPKPEVRAYEPNRPPPPSPAPTPATRRTADVDSIPDSWQLRMRVPPAPEEKPGEPAVRSGPKRKPAHKRRGISLNISVSTEEEHMIKSFAASKGMGFSEWARQVMFQAMRRKEPRRE